VKYVTNTGSDDYLRQARSVMGVEIMAVCPRSMSVWFIAARVPYVQVVYVPRNVTAYRQRLCEQCDVSDKRIACGLRGLKRTCLF
jgi:hypothetical protein